MRFVFEAVEPREVRPPATPDELRAADGLGPNGVALVRILAAVAGLTWDQRKALAKAELAHPGFAPGPSPATLAQFFGREAVFAKLNPEIFLVQSANGNRCAVALGNRDWLSMTKPQVEIFFESNGAINSMANAVALRDVMDPETYAENTAPWRAVFGPLTF